MDEIMSRILPQLPAIALLLYAIKTLYLDAKSERADMIKSINALASKIDLLIVVLVSDPDKLSEVKRIYSDTLPKT